MRFLLALAFFVAPLAAQSTLTYVNSVNPGEGPCGIAYARRPGRNFLLVGSHFEDRVTSFAIDPNNGSLNPAGVADVAPGSGPAAIGFAYGRYAVVANQKSSDLYVYRLNRQGALKQVGRPVSSRGLNPADMAVAPTGLVAVTNNESNQLSAFWIDRRGGLHFLDKINTGLKPAGVAISGTRIAVANSHSANVSIFRIHRRQDLQQVSTTALDRQPLNLAFGRDGLNLYVATAAPAQGQLSQLKRFSLDPNDPNGVLTEIASLDAGQFLSALKADDFNVYGATVNEESQNELRVYDLDLNQIAGVKLNSPPNSMTLATGRFRDGGLVFLNEFGNSSTSTFRLVR